MWKYSFTSVAAIVSLAFFTSCEDNSQAKSPGSFPGGGTGKMARLLKDGERNNLLVTGKHRAGDLASLGDGKFEHDGSALYSVFGSSFRSGLMQGGKRTDDYILEITTLDRRHLRLSQVREAVLFDDSGHVIWATDEVSRERVEAVFGTTGDSPDIQVTTRPEVEANPGAIPEDLREEKPGILERAEKAVKERIPSIFDDDGDLLPENS